MRAFTLAYGSDADQADSGGRTVLDGTSSPADAQSYDAEDPTTISDAPVNVVSAF